jgi:predicted DNA-binding transcriptional regulator YafY
VNRTDRLYAIVEELRARAPRSLSASDLARRFEVSARTIERDILALQESGVPIWSQTGRRGGYTLDPRRTLPPVNFTAEEATAIAVALAASRNPFGAAGQAATRKLVAAMAEADSEAASKLASRVWVTWPARPPARPEIVSAVESAVADRMVLRIDYTDRGGQPTRRLVEAHGIAGGPGAWYLVGWCRTRDGPRTFKINRISSAALTSERAPERDLEDLLGWAGAKGRSAAGLLYPDIEREEAMDKAKLLGLLERRRAEWEGCLERVPLERFDEPNAYGDWSAKDVVNHVNSYARFEFHQLRSALDGVAATNEELRGSRPELSRAETSVDDRNYLINESGRGLSLEYLFDEGRSVHAQLIGWVRGLSERDLEERVGWVPYWEPGAVAEPNRIVRRVSEVAGLTQVTKVGEWLAGLHAHAAEHASGLESWLQAGAAAKR